MTTTPDLKTIVGKLGSGENGAKGQRWDKRFVARYREAEDCGLAVNINGWWWRTVKGDEYVTDVRQPNQAEDFGDRLRRSMERHREALDRLAE